MRKSIILIIVFFKFLFVTGQTEIINESFQFNFVENKNQIIYKGDNHYFTINLNKKSKLIEVENNQNNENQNFIEVNGVIIGFSIMDIPNNITDSLDFSNLTIGTQESILKNYLEYELNYFEKELKVKIDNLLIQARDYKSKSYYFVRFNTDFKGDALDSNSDTITKVAKGQLYLCSIQFNKILVINIPFFEQNSIEETSNLIKSFVRKIKTFDKEYK
jgi:hypothetical protein